MTVGRQAPRVLSLAEVETANWQPSLFLAYDAGDEPRGEGVGRWHVPPMGR